jgi:nitrate reductase gamma subunit
VPWHYGVIAILTTHVLAFLFPTGWATLLAAPARLYFLEVTGLALALCSLAGLAVLTGRRLANARAFTVTSALDWVLLTALLGQVGLGFWVSLFYRWGSEWYLHTAVPWLISLLLLNPQVEYVNALPLPVRLHMLGGFVIIGLFPFTRLVHLATVPIPYLWRPYQVVIWNRRHSRGKLAG